CTDVLKAGWAEGRLTDAEYHERLELALKAQTYGQLRALVRDLPNGPVPSAPQAAPPAVNPYPPAPYNPYAPPVWGYPHVVLGRPAPKTNPLATASLLTAVLSFGPGWFITWVHLYGHPNPYPIVFGLIAVITGAIALRQIHRRPYPENGG